MTATLAGHDDDISFIDDDWNNLCFDCDIEYMEEAIPGVPFWSLSGTTAMGQYKRDINRLEVLIARDATPEPDTEVSRHIRRLAVALGVSKGKALTYCTIGTMFRRMPMVAEQIEQSCVFSFDHLREIANAVEAVDDSYCEKLDLALCKLLSATKPRQAVPGVVTLRRMVAELVATIEPSARPITPECVGELPPPQSQLDFGVDDRSPASTTMTVTVPTDEGLGALRIIDAVAEALECSRAQAFIEVVYGRADKVNVTLNCYRNLDSGTMHLESTWLDDVATERWMARVTELCVVGHSGVKGRKPSPHQKATVAGRDAVCRFPGCDKAAAVSQLDHVTRWEEEDGTVTGGPTATWNLHSLCPGCHALKTRGLWDVTLNPDGSTWWTSLEDGHQYIDEPTGPLADAVMTFDKRLHRKVRTVAAHNRARQEHLEKIQGACPF